MKNPNSRFNFIRYANVWEDADLLCEALAPTAHQGNILSISSSGDNVLALLTLDPKKIVAIDLSAPQLACLQLRIAAFKELDHTSLCQFLGVHPSENRISTYKDLLKCHLSAPATAFWDERLSEIQNGVIHAGKFERYLRLFGKWVLPFIHSRSTIEELLKPKPLQKRLDFYNQKWDRWKWRLLFKLFFSRSVMGHAGRDPSFFNHVQGTVAKQILARTKHALTQCPTHQNPYLHYILKGNFGPETLPRYLRPKYFHAIQSRVDRIQLVQGPVTQVEERFDAFNLSDIFEYMNEAEFEACYQTILAKASPNARLVYWNLLVPRSCPKSCLHRVTALTELATLLHTKDQAWFYQKLLIEQCAP
jgi:S-adenosylmethionine-diacylglycerol 3-amino-3-carboxypropyl transferase